MADLKDIARTVRDSADIVAVVGRYVVLKKAGASYKGVCPFHKEKTPSFNVVPAKGIFHCFGCGAGGSVIDFIMRIERLEFMDALRKLAEELGIELPAPGPREDRAARDEAENRLRALQGVLDFANKWFRENLRERRNPAANDYLIKRDITPEMVEAFQLGASLDGWDHLAEAARGRGYSEQLLLDAGLCKRHETRGTLYDVFRNRLMFPIADHLGRIVAFGGRDLDPDPKMGKYLNSPETEIYKKSKTLYALNLAHKSITDSGYALLTEGYMDTLMAHRFGFSQAVASLGTAFTPDQARLLKRYASRVYFLYDGDSAGQKAMLRAGEPLLGAGLDTRVITLPEGHDPDSFLREKGPEALGKLIESAREYFDFALDAHSSDLELSRMAGQTSLVERIAPLLLAAKNDVQRELAVTRLLGRLGGLPREAVYRILDKKRQTRPDGEAAEPSEQREVAGFDREEYYALKLMLESDEALEILRHELQESWLTDRRLEPWITFFMFGEESAERMLAEAEQSGELPGPMSIITAALADVQPLGDAEHSARQIAARLKKRHFRQISRQLLRNLNEIQENGAQELPENLLNMIHQEHLLAFKTKLPPAPLDVV